MKWQHGDLHCLLLQADFDDSSWDTPYIIHHNSIFETNMYTLNVDANAAWTWAVEPFTEADPSRPLSCRIQIGMLHPFTLLTQQECIKTCI